MNKLICMTILILSSCGYVSRDNELIGQVKKVKHMTPIICYDHTIADVSLGVMRNGVGSMSSQDVFVRVPERMEATFKQANETGALVKVKYDELRIVFCVPEYQVTSVEILQ